MPKPNKGEGKQDFLKRCTSELMDSEGRKSDQAFAMCNMAWNEDKGKKLTHPILLSAPLSFELSADDSQAPDTFLMTAYTGQVIEMGWYGRYVFEVAGMKAKSKIPILREHTRDRVVGWSQKAWADRNQFLISGQFSKSTPDAREVLALAQEGYPWQASVGIKPVKIKRLESDKESFKVNGAQVSGPLVIWLESEVGEVSFVSLGADGDTAAIALADQLTEAEEGLNHEENCEMTLQELKEKHPDIYQAAFGLGAASIDAGKIETEAKAAGAAEERARVMEILKAEGDQAMTLKAIEDGTSAQDAGWIFYRAEKENRSQKLEDLKAGLPESAGHGAKQTDKSGPRDFEKLVEAHMKEHNCSRGKAISAVAKANPEAHDAYLATCKTGNFDPRDKK